MTLIMKKPMFIQHLLDYIKEQLNEQFPNLNEEYLDLLADNHLSKLYDKQ